MKYSSNRAAIASYFHEQKLFGRGQKHGRNLAGARAAKISCPFRILIAGVKATRIYRRNFIWPSLRDGTMKFRPKSFFAIPARFSFFSFFFLPICSLTDFVPFRWKTKTRIDRPTIKRCIEYHESIYACSIAID